MRHKERENNERRELDNIFYSVWLPKNSYKVKMNSNPQEPIVISLRLVNVSL